MSPLRTPPPASFACRCRHWGLALLALLTVARGGAERHLFLEPEFLTQSSGVSFAVNAPQRSEVVIRPDRAWEQLMISFYTTVIEEQGKIRLWYICRDADNRPNLAYAESSDGVTWTKPNLGIVDYHGSTDNNLVGVPSLDGAVARDPHGRAGEDYVYVGHVHGEGVFRYTSADGLHWKRDAQALLAFRADTQNVVFWDERIQRYALYLRGWDLADRWENRLRKVVRLEADDLSGPIALARSGKGDNPTRPEDLPRIVDEVPTVLAADGRDPRGTDVYTISAQPYPLDPRWYLGFPSFFRRDKNISDGRLEVHFVGSREGIDWERYDRAPYVRLGLEGGDNANMVFIGPGMVIRGDEIWQFGTGFRNRHGAVEHRKERADGVIYRHVQRVDGFVSLDFAVDGGRAQTRPVRVEGPRLLVNVDTGALGDLRVGLLDGDGNALPGFDLEDCLPLQTNETSAVVTWKGGADLTALHGREVRVAFAGVRARLYSFRFSEP